MVLSALYIRPIFKFAVILTWIFIIGSLYGFVIGVPRGPDWVYVGKTVFLIISFILMRVWYLKAQSFLGKKNYRLNKGSDFLYLTLIGISIAILVWVLVKIGVMLSPLNDGVYLDRISANVMLVLSTFSIWLTTHVSLIAISALSLFSAWIITTLGES